MAKESSFARGLEDFKPLDPAIHGEGWIGVVEHPSESEYNFIGIIRPGFVPQIGSIISMIDSEMHRDKDHPLYEVIGVFIQTMWRRPEDQLTAFAEAEAIGKTVPTLPSFVFLAVERVPDTR